MKASTGLGLFVLAALVVVGAFAYFIVRGGSDAVIVPIMAISLSTVLQFFFASHLVTGAANGAVASAIEANRAQQVAVDHATTAAVVASVPKP